MDSGLAYTGGIYYRDPVSSFNRYCVSCKLWDDDIKNRIFEAVPTVLADQICIDMDGTKAKDAIFENVKSAVVKIQSIFLYRKDFHELKQSREEDSERFECLNMCSVSSQLLANTKCNLKPRVI